MTLPLDAILNILDQECQEGNFDRPLLRNSFF